MHFSNLSNRLPFWGGIPLARTGALELKVRPTHLTVDLVRLPQRFVTLTSPDCGIELVRRVTESAEISCEHLVAPPDMRKVGIPSDLLILHAPQSAIGGYKHCEKKG